MSRASSKSVYIEDECDGYPVESFCVSPQLSKYLSMVLIPGGFVHDRIERLACDIVGDLQNESFVALCVLKGGYQFFNDLLDKIRQLHRYRYSGQNQTPPVDQLGAQQIRVEFIRLKSYEDDKSSGNIRVIGIESLDALRGKNVLIVEDIIDTGKTMVKLLDLLQNYELKSTRVATLFVKRTRLSNGFQPDYVGFNIPDLFIVGCNIDYNEYFRDLNHVCVISDEGKRKFATVQHNAVN